jgi:hypothetical protein
MQLTSILPPAYYFVKEIADLLAQLGATKVEATDSTTVKVTYADNDVAANASALFKDTVRGAKLVVEDTSGVREPGHVSADGIANVLRGVEGLEVYEIEGTPTEVYGVTFDPKLQSALSALVDRTPVAGVTVEIPKA